MEFLAEIQIDYQPERIILPIVDYEPDDMEDMKFRGIVYVQCDDVEIGKKLSKEYEHLNNPPIYAQRELCVDVENLFRLRNIYREYECTFGFMDKEDRPTFKHYLKYDFIYAEQIKYKLKTSEPSELEF